MNNSLKKFPYTKNTRLQAQPKMTYLKRQVM